MIKDNYLDINKIVEDKKILRLFRAVESHGGVLRFVGGCVRDAIKGIKGFDLDLATDLCPDELVEACEEKAIKTKPIGIQHGTVGVIIGDKLIEVTSLRRDVKTDGRHAEVEYTDSWDVDASRRDLTINAVYADEKGNVFDYYNGLEDLEKGVVKFIGNPNARIKEDYLRILRFFRFYGVFGKTPIDEKALKACVENKDGLKKLSSERISSELNKICRTSNPAKILQIMFENGILDAILPSPQRYEALERMTILSSDPLLRLFALYLPNEKLANNLSFILKMNNKDKEFFIKLANVTLEPKDFLVEANLKKMVYTYGREFVKAKLLLKIAQNKLDANIKDAKILEIEAFEIPSFEVKGVDLIQAGIPQGAEIKTKLKELEAIWINSNFSLSKKDLLIKL